MRRCGLCTTSALLCALSQPLSAQSADEREEDGSAMGIEDSEQIVVTAKDDSRWVLGESRLEAQEAAELAGTQGDALKALQTISGVGRPGLGSQGLSVWGGPPRNTRLYIDDIPVPRLFHLGGSRSILPTSRVALLRVEPGGAGARYGRAIGGVVNVRTRSLFDEATGMYAELDPITVGAGMQVRDIHGNWLSVGAREGLLNSVFQAVAPKRSRELVFVPNFRDFQLLGGTRLDEITTLSFVGFGSQDELARTLPSIRSQDQFSERNDTWFYRMGLRLNRSTQGRKTQTLVLWVGVDGDKRNQLFSDVSAFEKRREVLGGLLLFEERSIQPWARLQIGTDVEFSRARTTRNGAITLPTRPGDIAAFGQAPGDRINSDTWKVRRGDVAVFATLLAQLGPLHVEPGIRFAPRVLSGNRVLPVRPTEPAVGYSELRLPVAPRLRLNWEVTPELRLYTATGRYHQSPAPSDLSPVFGNPSLAQEKAWQLLFGGHVRPVQWLSLEGTVFGAVEDNIGVRSSSPTPPIANLLVSEGRGRTVGAKVSALVEPGLNTNFAVTYSLMRTQRRDHPGESWRLSDADQTHLLRASATWRREQGLSLGAHFELASGFPRTPVVGSYFNARTQGFDPIFGTHNGERLPLFASLSLRAGWSVDGTWGRAQLWAEVQNVANRNNIEEYFYSHDYSQRYAVRGLPVLPFVGAKVQL